MSNVEKIGILNLHCREKTTYAPFLCLYYHDTMSTDSTLPCCFVQCCQCNVEKIPQALYVQCYKHRLNLALVNVWKNILSDLLGSLYVFQVVPQYMLSLFLELQKKMFPNKKPMELTRIVYSMVRTNSCLFIPVKVLFSVKLVLLKKVVAEKRERSAEANGILSQIEFKFTFLLCSYNNLVLIVKGASDYLQKVDADMSEGLILVLILHTTKCINFIYDFVIH